MHHSHSNATVPLTTSLVLIGGGHAHVHILKSLGMTSSRYNSVLQSHGIQVTLIAKDVMTPYSGMLPGYLAGFYGYDDIHLDLVKLCSFAASSNVDVRLIHSACCKITYDKVSNQKLVFCEDGRPPIRYDCLSIDVGCTPSGNYVNTATASASVSASSATGAKADSDDSNYNKHAVIPVKPIASFADRYNGMLNHIQTHANIYSNKCKFTLAVVGGGAGGVEVCLSAHRRLQDIFQSDHKTNNGATNRFRVMLLTKGNVILPGHNPRVQSIFQRIFDERGIDIHYGADVISSTILNNNSNTPKNNNHNPYPESQFQYSSTSTFRDEITFHACLWCTSAGAASWLSQATPFETDENGFLLTNDHLQCLNHPGVFAAGDCANIINHVRPKAGVFAVRAGPPLLENIMRYLTIRSLVSYKPQTDFLSLISTGEKYAVASRGNLIALEGAYLWKLKDFIDQQWMKRYKEFPDMSQSDTNYSNSVAHIPPSIQSKGSDVISAFTAAAMRCGGCGAKVGASTVSRVLASIQNRTNNYYGNDPNSTSSFSTQFTIEYDDAAIIPITKDDINGCMIHTVDYFRSFISDPFIFGKIAAVHALSDCHAMGATAKTALAVAVVPYAAVEEMTEETLTLMLSGASDMLNAEKCALVGGHTCEGSELALGFAINGFVSNSERVLRKRGGRIGDIVVLTKPIGTGALFAANMRAKGDSLAMHVSEALSSMIQSNITASNIAMQMNRSSRDYNAIRACTDVTGFGLMGHLLEMLLANDDDNSNSQVNRKSELDMDCIGCNLYIDQIPFLKGGIEASRMQIYSSLQRENYRNRRAIFNHVEAMKKFPLQYPLLFDPQTAGGLLFFVDPSKANKFIHTLKESGVSCAAAIGMLTPYVHDNKMIDNYSGSVCVTGSKNRTMSRIVIDSSS